MPDLGLVLRLGRTPANEKSEPGARSFAVWTRLAKGYGSRTASIEWKTTFGLHHIIGADVGNAAVGVFNDNIAGAVHLDGQRST